MIYETIQTLILSNLDCVLTFIILIYCVCGFIRGFIKELITTASWVMAVIIAGDYAMQFAAFVLKYCAKATSPASSMIPFSLLVISYLILFVGVLLGGTLFEFAVRPFYVISSLGFINRILGAVFGLLRGLGITAIIIFAMSYTPLNHDLRWQNSLAVKYSTPVFTAIRNNPKLTLMRIDYDKIDYNAINLLNNTPSTSTNKITAVDPAQST